MRLDIEGKAHHAGPASDGVDCRATGDLNTPYDDICEARVTLVKQWDSVMPYALNSCSPGRACT